MERLNWHIADELSRHANVHVIGPLGAAALKPKNVELSEVSLRPLWKFLLSSARQSISTARRIRPDIVLAGSGLTAPAALLAARSSKARAAVYVHGLDVAVRHPVYRSIWHPSIRHMDIVIANSHPTARLVQELGVEESKIRIVHPGVTLPDAPQTEEALRAFRERHNLGNARLLLSIGRLTTRKGLREFVQQALPAIVEKAPNTLLVVIGDAPSDALHTDVQTPQSIQDAASAARVGNNVRFLGKISEDQLNIAYAAADIHVFPVRELRGDPEGFGMVAIEAAAHGLPTVAFASGGIVDAVQDGVSGRLIANADYPALASAVVDLLQHPAPQLHDASRGFAERFAWPCFQRELWAALMPDSGPSPAGFPSAKE